MITKKELDNLENIKKEQEDLEDRINKLESKGQQTVTDSVKGSSSEFPYTQHNCVVTGLEEDKIYRRKKNTIKKLKKMYKNNASHIDKSIVHIEYELKKIEDSEIRQIIRYKYEDNLSWIQIMHRMNYNSEEAPRIKLKRFFEKFDKCTDCTVL